MTQREGRILRQGNTNKKVIIFRYITEGSFDAYSWQLLETKQRFITALLSGTMTDRSGSDVDDTVLDYAEVKALAVGNPLVKERVETYNELTRYRTLQKKLVDMRIALGKEINDIPSKIAYQNSLIEKCAADIAFYEKNKREYKKEERRIIRKRIFDAVRENSFATAETELMNYQGFTVVLPANMSAEKPYVWLVREGRDYTEIGDSEIGALIRVDNCLGELKEHLNELNNGLDKLTDRERSIAAELAKDDSYQGKIEECKVRLDKIDKSWEWIKNERYKDVKYTKSYGGKADRHTCKRILCCDKQRTSGKSSPLRYALGPAGCRKIAGCKAARGGNRKGHGQADKRNRCATAPV